MKKVLLYLYVIFLFIIILDGVLFAFLSAIYLGFFSYEVAFLDIPIIIWGIVNALIFIILFALPIWFLNFLNKKLDLDGKFEKVHKKIMLFLK
tara:strand:+ start:1243 stop:1521 length:279 start_codon:yes stop_codon:yes gene_type:complete